MTENKDLVNRFSEEMLKKLEARVEKHGGSWKNVSIWHLRGRLIQEFNEWKQMIESEFEPNELIDIANQCMLLYFRLKEKEEK